jgi:demethylmenaquinone methyltransferase/2-methoxy-6-polyprenyl-1,4-benzoquinol methylase
MTTKIASADGSGRMFDGIAEKYDLLNRINSLGMDRAWRRTTIRALELRPGDRVLDLATGTADLPIDLLAHQPDLSVVGLDPSIGMLSIGERKVKHAGLHDRVELVSGDARELPFEADSFDAITMAFGIRNVPDRPAALREMARVLKPGRRVGILELSEPRNGVLAALARLHVRFFVPLAGALVSGKDEYAYLRASIEAFPRPEAFAAMMRDAGLEPVDRRSFAFGACVLHVATVGGAEA